jgi:hypothetical protein
MVDAVALGVNCGNAALRFAFGTKRTLTEPRLKNRIYEYTP